MNRRTLLSAVLVFAFFAPLSAYSQKVNVDWDHGFHDFSALKTYQWVRPIRPAPNPLVNKRIMEAVDSQMSAKGFQKVEGRADVLVTYSAGVRQERSATVIGGGRFRLGGGMATIHPNVSNVGTLLVDIVDARTRELLWRGTATDTLSEKPEKNTKKIEQAVAKMFKKYPPPVK